jgi:leukotriene-A4 hydrolase
MGNSIDSSTYANIQEIRTEKLHMNLTVNFADESFTGYAVHELEALQDGVQGVYFDVVGMDISSVKQSDSPTPGAGNETTPTMNLTTPNTKLGQALGVQLASPTVKGQTYYIYIYYKTNNQTTSISWLKPAQTFGKKMPYLYTQCEDVACRSLAPL